MKEYPGYNFIGLIFGPASDTQKRLEKETGAKIRVYGTKADTGGKVEVTPTDGKEAENAYEDLYVHVSADTYEKVDAAVALIELLVTPVSVNPVSSSTTSTAVSDGNVSTPLSQSTPSSVVTPTMLTQGTAQPYVGSLPPLPGQFPQQYPQAWFPAGPTQTPTYPHSGLVAPANTSATMLGNNVQVSSSPFNPTNIPSLFGQRPATAASFSSVLQNPSVVPSRPQLTHALQPPYMQQAAPLVHTGGPRNPPLPISQPATGPSNSVRAVISTSPQFTHLASPLSTSASRGLTNLMPMTPPVVPSHGHNAMASQNVAISGAPPMNVPNHMISPLSGPTQSGVAVASQPPRGGFSPLLPSAAPASTIQSSPIIPVQPALPQVGMRGPYPNAVPGPASMPFPGQSSTPLPQPGIPNSFAGSGPNFDSRRPLSAGLPRPHQPSSSDFTFQPHRLPNTASQVAWQSNQPANHNMRPPVQAGQSPLLRPMAHNLNPSPSQGFPGPQMSHQVNQPRAQIPTNFGGSPTMPLIPPRHPTLPGQPRNFIPPHPINNSSGPFPPRPGSQMHIQENHHPGAIRSQRVPTPHQHFGNHPGRPFFNSSVTQQVYDPFSPTTASFNAQMGGNARRVHGESDPEYEDLMESVGVK
ncbi:Splicing factor 1/branch point binding protein (RRM superfamily) [Handroanthus impetiginosus]|uniref:Splicing factor 1/branch point binding protein (RRM superfamily) n=1 Tax=Handroanthus impetiginosus TaxID=429701 RepID=A0A2G9H0B6_9LAMI|nr:Splicing factor 1/branch point binding protein (RRM superfamily) [Handroanthus impetiginosus]